MTTRQQRERLLPIDQIETAFGTDACRQIWDHVFRDRSGAMPASFQSGLQLRVRAYLELAHEPSAGELNTALDGLHRSLTNAIEDNDLEAAAAALERLPEPIRAKLDRMTPGGIPTTGQLADPVHGIEIAKELLGCCVRGADIVAGRNRSKGRQSRPRLKLEPRFKQGRGYPRQEAEAMLVRALAEHWRSFSRSGRFPRACAHSGSQPMSPFERLVHQVLQRSQASDVNTRKLGRRILGEMRIAEVGTD